jgi:hypothetical protein
MSDKQTKPDQVGRAAPLSPKVKSSGPARSKRPINQRLSELLVKLRPFPTGD